MVNKLVAAAGLDPAAEKDGAWFEYSAGGSIFRVKLARAGTGNAEFMKLQNKLLRPWRAGARGGQAPDIPHEADRKIQRELYGTVIAVDWDADDFGEPFSKEAIIRTFVAMNDFLDWVITISNQQESFRKAELEEAQGN
jgi:hypothetical protein